MACNRSLQVRYLSSGTFFTNFTVPDQDMLPSTRSIQNSN